MTLRVAERIEVTGVVQGVGFRPFVHRLATELGLDGCVGNDPVRVFVEAAGPVGALDELVRRLRAEAPPLARVDHIERRPLGPAAGAPGTGFRIIESRTGSRTGEAPRALVPPDSAACDDCLAELFDPADRRHRHPFITCTNCGPRFTIITALPYDRPATTMAGFPLCSRCAAEYGDPTDRRYHAQPIACPDCGPTLTFQRVGSPGVVADRPRSAGEPRAGEPLAGEWALAGARAALLAGEVVAVKGLGGFHLACDATSDDAVARLRARKQRPDKPFAVMVADLAGARGLAHLTEGAVRALMAPARPVVLAPAVAGGGLSASVAPGNPLVGVMVAYTPVHHLLLHGAMPPLVMTSANLGGEPIIHTDDEAASRLGVLCDAVLTHDRPIAVPCDDSVVRVDGDRLLPVRRARGFAPIPVSLTIDAGLSESGLSESGLSEPGLGEEAVLAVGGELKNTFCLAAGGRAHVSQHLGDMENYATLLAFEASVARLQSFHGISPRIVAVDAHPGYATHAWARRRFTNPGTVTGRSPDQTPEQNRVDVIEVQHHHAHIGSVLAEHGWDPRRPVIGFAFDGTGYGTDGTIWGGEVLVATATGFDRAAHLAPVPLPGGDAAIRNPYRVALAHLWAAAIAWSDDLAPVARLGPGERDLLVRQLERGVACVPSTSMGRLFDAVASLVDLRHEISFEAQAAIDLELAALAAPDADPGHPSRAEPGGSDPGRHRFGFDGRVIDPAPVLAAIVADLRTGVPREVIALCFHRAVADVVARVAGSIRARRELDTVALSGGVFQNVLVLDLCRRRLTDHGFAVLSHELVPPNDGGLALGQAWIAAHTHSAAAPRPPAATGRRAATHTTNDRRPAGLPTEEA